MSGGALYIALSGLEAQQTGLDVVAQNVANANTPGYRTESVDLANQQLAGNPMGDGVSVAGVLQAQNTFAQALAYSATSANAYAKQLSSTLSAAQSTSFAEPAPSGISELLNGLWSAFGQLSDAPTQLASYQSVVTAAEQVAGAINQAASGLTQLYRATQEQASLLATQVNQQLAQVASLNAQIASVQGSEVGAGNSLVDSRNQVLSQLASEIGATVVPGPSGQVSVLVGGVTLVQGAQASTIAVAASAPGDPPATSDTASVVLAGTTTQVPISSGTMGGLLAALNGNLPRYGTALNAVATTLADQVNQQLAAGQAQGPSGPQAGPALFVAQGGGPLTAASLAVNPTIVQDPQLIAASASPYAGANGQNAAAIAGLGTSPAKKKE
jgi:flagellar hook-associated protein 1 FlgK